MKVTFEEKPNRKNSLARRNRKPIKVWVTDEEREMIIQKAEKKGLSGSAYLRKKVMEKEDPSRVNWEALEKLRELNEELGKMDYLLRYWWHTRDPKTVIGLELEGVMKKCQKIQTEMMSVISKLAK